MPASRSLIALLVGTIVLFGLVFVELKPGSSSSGGGSSSSHGLGAYQPDINKAKQAVGISNASNAASGNVNASGSSATQTTSSSSTAPADTSASAASSSAKPSSASSPKPVTTSPAAKPAAHPATAADNLKTVKAAMTAHRVVAMLFYNAGAADDQAVKHELSSVPTHRGRVVKLAIPLSQAAKFTAVTQQVPLNFSPTLVLIDPNGQASEILGYTDTFEIDQRVDDALAAG